MLGRLVTRPLRWRAAEVGHMGEGNLDAMLSPQRSPELRELAGRHVEMCDDLLRPSGDSTRPAHGRGERPRLPRAPDRQR